MKPPVTQKIMQRRFKGFTPQQKAMILATKNLQDGTPAAAKELAKATSIAMNEINKRFNAMKFYQGGDPARLGERKRAATAGQEGAYTYKAKGAANKGKYRVNVTPEAKQEAEELGVNVPSRAYTRNSLRVAETAKKFNEELAAARAKKKESETVFTTMPITDSEESERTETPSTTIPPEEKSDTPPITIPPGPNTIAPPTGPVDILESTEDILRGGVGLSDAAKPDPVLISDEEVEAGEIDEDVGQIDASEEGSPTVTATLGTPTIAAVPEATAPATITDPQLTQPNIGAAAQVAPVSGAVSPQAQVTAQQLTPQQLASLNIEAAQLDTPQQIDAPDPRVIQSGELVTGIDADATRAAQFTEQVEAAQGEVGELSTVKGQLAQLQKEFDNDEIPIWATGAYRQTQQALAARGLSSSSLAGQAIVQAFMESAIPIAQADAQVFANFDLTNLSNRQQRAMLAAQQRATFIGLEFDQAFQARVTNAAKISDIANINFSAEQQIAIENSRLAQTVDIANLNNRQAKIMADAGAMVQVELSSLNNRQEAAVQNAKSFLQMDMSNLGFEQQAAMFEAQSRVQSLFSDQAAINAAKNFNAQSENEMTRFFEGLINNTNLQNAAQQNAMEQFNVDAANSIAQFNSQLINQRELWNAENQRYIAESNANWRRAVTTTNNATTNASQQIAAQNQANLEMRAYDNLWQRNRDVMNFAFSTAATKDQFAHELLLASAENKGTKTMAAGTLLGAIINGFFGNTDILKSLFP